jgi:hypothetical protein
MPEISIKFTGLVTQFNLCISFFYFLVAGVKDDSMYLSKGIEPPDIVSMFLRAKFKQEVKERIATTSLHNSLFEGASSVQNRESHCVNHMAEMIVIGWKNHYIGNIWGKNLVDNIKSFKIQKELNNKTKSLSEHVIIRVKHFQIPLNNVNFRAKTTFIESAAKPQE